MNEQSTINLRTDVIENRKTSKKSLSEHHMLMPTATMESFIKVQHVRNYQHPDDSLQISIDCLALNYEVEVFELDINYTPQNIAIRDQLLNSFRQGGLMHVKGQYSIASDEEEGVAIILHDPEYHSVAPQEISDVAALF